MQELGSRLRDVWNDGATFRLTAPAGTELSGRIDGRPGYYVAGISQPQPGVKLRSCAFPDGEAGVAPVSETVNGRVVFDIAMLHTGIGALRSPVALDIRDGRIEAVEGDGAAAALREYLETRGDEGARLICEVSIGLNPSIRLNGSKNDKKKLGTMHVGFGANEDIGGPIKSRLHYDGVIDRPTLEVDERTVLSAGSIL
jgi:leucyl aminopeptidase (aminopeptidase T)